MNNNKQKSTGPKKGFMGGGPMGMTGTSGEKAKEFKATVKKLLSYLKPYRISIITVLIFAFGSAAFAIFGPKILGEATTEIFEGLISKISDPNGIGIDFTTIGRLLLVMIGLYITSSIFSFVQGFIMAGVAQKVSFNLRKAISEKINKLPLKYFDKQNHGEILSRVTNDVDTVSQTLSQSMSDTITSVTMIIGVLIMMLTINIKMTLITLLIIPVSLCLLILIVKNSQKYFKQTQDYLGNINGYVEEIYGGHNIMRVFNGEKRSLAEFDAINNKLHGSAWKAQFLSGMMNPIMTFIGNLGYVIVSILGGWFAIQKTITVGDILSFIQYIRLFMQPIGQMAQITNTLQSTVAAAERVFDFLAEEEEKADKDATLGLHRVKGEVVFKNVSFGYNADTKVIKDFSIVIKPGQNVAIVGPTGAGKTTIVKLLMRFYEINSGTILIDNHDIKAINRNSLRNTIGMVLQDTWLFNGTIMDNIRYGKLNATDEEVMEVTKTIQIDHFIHTLPDGYNMVINEEANNISQGEKQLLTIARAFLSDPKILILDEATSSVDTRTEVLIQQSMEKLMKNRTSFIIAHRLSTIRNADLILVMKDGDIVEHGKHEDLLVANGFYATLYNSQFETNTLV